MHFLSKTAVLSPNSGRTDEICHVPNVLFRARGSCSPSCPGHLVSTAMRKENSSTAIAHALNSDKAIHFHFLIYFT